MRKIISAVIACVVLQSFSSTASTVVPTHPVLNCNTVVYSTDGEAYKSKFQTTTKGTGAEFDTVHDNGIEYVFEVQGNENVAGSRLVLNKRTLKGEIVAYDYDGNDIADGDVTCTK